MALCSAVHVQISLSAGESLVCWRNELTVTARKPEASPPINLGIGHSIFGNIKELFMNGMHKALFLIVVTLCFFGAGIPVFAQGTNSGTIRGRVTDPNGASVTGASVKVTDLGTG